MKLTHKKQALSAAYALCEETEWSASGLMLRVSIIDKPQVAMSFALKARADCLNERGREICTSVIQFLEHSK